MRGEDSKIHVIASGKKIILRDGLPSDLNQYIRWMKKGEWTTYDAPWENAYLYRTDEETRKRFLKKFVQDLSAPRCRAIIATKENCPLGWVNRYGDKRFPSTWLVGIDICEDDCLNKGLGTEAFRLWINYLFANSDIHRIGYDTYSFNTRMIRIGEKLGFCHEGTEREVLYWQKRWIDRLHFGILRKEWRVFKI